MKSLPHYRDKSIELAMTFLALTTHKYVVTVIIGIALYAFVPVVMR